MRYLKYFLDGDGIDAEGQDPYAEGESSREPVYWNDNTGQYYDESGNAKFDTNLDAAGKVELKNMKVRNANKAAKQGKKDAFDNYDQLFGRKVTWTGTEKGKHRYTGGVPVSAGLGLNDNLLEGMLPKERNMDQEMQDAYDNAFNEERNRILDEWNRKEERKKRLETMSRKGGDEGVKAMQDEVRYGQDEFLDTAGDMWREGSKYIGYGLDAASFIPGVGQYVLPVKIGFNGVNALLNSARDISKGNYDKIVGDVAPFAIGLLTQPLAGYLTGQIQGSLGNLSTKTSSGFLGNALDKASTSGLLGTEMKAGLNYGKGKMLKGFFK